MVFYIPGGAGFCPSTVSQPEKPMKKFKVLLSNMCVCKFVNFGF